MAEPRKLRLKKYGWRPDKPDIRDMKFAAPRALVGALPSKMDLRRGCPAPYNQGELGSCHDAQTEILTKNGWKLFPDLTDQDLLATVDPVSGNLIYEKPVRIIKFPFSGNLICGKHKNLDFKVTPDHKMVVRCWDEEAKTLRNNYQFIDAKNLGWYVGLMNKINYLGDCKDDFYVVPGIATSHCVSNRSDLVFPMEWWLKFLGIYLAEGTLLKEQYKIQIAASKFREKEFVKEVLTNLKINFLELEDRFTLNNQRVFMALKSLGFEGVKASQKFVPSFVFQLPASQINYVLHGHFMGDGCEQEGFISHYTSSKRLADDLQLLIFLSGKWANIHIRLPRKSKIKGRVVAGKYPEYRIGVWNEKNLSIDKKANITEENYDGLVYCAEVPSYHTLVTRRNNKILISGNCTGQSIGGMIHYNLIKQNIAKAFQPSALFIYYNERVLENTVNEDAGAEIRNGIKSLVRWGICPEQYHPYVVSKFKTKPSKLAYNNALPHRIEKYMRIRQSENDLKACLAEDRPFVFGFMVHESFESDEVTKTGFVNMPGGSKDDPLGGHAVMAVGYDDETRRFLIRNSYGFDWGMEGYFTLPYDYVLNDDLADDFWCINFVPNE